jgi:3-oxoacyl-[acyl-carrier-protein] synthase-1
MACPLGLRWINACAAMRAGIERKEELKYCDNNGEPIIGSRLNILDESFSAHERWLSLLTFALSDAISQVDFEPLFQNPLILALPSNSNNKTYDATFLARELSSRLGIELESKQISIIAEGAYGGFQALERARRLLEQDRAKVCVVAGADSLINASSLLRLSEKQRLLIEGNSDGVIPGEAAACLVVTLNKFKSKGKILGMGFAHEEALIDNDIPLRANGVSLAAKEALKEAGFAMHDIDFRISDAAGESYAFKEQALLVGRLLRQKKEEFTLWKSADSLGDVGAAAGLCGLAYALAGFERGYAPGKRAIAFVGNESGARAALILEATKMGEAWNG